MVTRATSRFRTQLYLQSFSGVAPESRSTVSGQHSAIRQPPCGRLESASRRSPPRTPAKNYFAVLQASLEMALARPPPVAVTT